MYVLVYGLPTVQLSEGYHLRLSWGAGALLDIAVLLAGTGQNFLSPALCSSCLVVKAADPSLLCSRLALTVNF